jgi:Family of unknown function (DUF5681)
MTASQTKSASYDVGYGKPPRHAQFRKGQSGNPGGRPRGRVSVERLKALALHEAYRTMIVREEGRGAEPLSAIQAILRSQIKMAAEGNVRAQCAILKMIREIEQTAADEAEFGGSLFRSVKRDDAADDADDGYDDAADAAASFADAFTDAADDDAADDDAADDDAADDDAADDAADDDAAVEPARQADDGIAMDVEQRQEEPEQTVAPPSYAESQSTESVSTESESTEKFLEPENAESPRAAAAGVRTRPARGATTRRRARRERGRSSRTAAARKAPPPEPAAPPALRAGGTPALRPSVARGGKLKAPC